MNTDHSERFFANKECKYYPCHKCSTDINCLFCYCPLYDMDCPGNYQMKEINGRMVKNCTDCVFPHIPDNYDRIMELLKQKYIGS